ncbi:MAG: glutaredoxin domain-containing protein [Anaerolineaceae bacterium]|jgi:mycoredoxin|nr:glutaredoxin domain-containing protein [Anaerolineaceae bacterium]
MENTKIIMYGTTWCGDTKRAKKFFEEHQIDYEWINIDKDSEGSKRVQALNNGFKSVPTIIFPDGSILVEPDNETLRNKFVQSGLL